MIKLVHLLSRPNDERERLSVQSLSPIEKFGIPYVQRINPPFVGPFPEGADRLPPREMPLQPGQYGCFKAHREAILNEFTDDLDFLLVCECDCKLMVPLEGFVELVNNYPDEMKANEIACLGIGSFCEGVTGGSNNFYKCNRLICTQSLLYDAKYKTELVNALENFKWFEFDFWISDVCKNKLAVTQKRITSQHEGVSLAGLRGKNVRFTDAEDARIRLIQVIDAVPRVKVIGKKK